MFELMEMVEMFVNMRNEKSRIEKEMKPLSDKIRLETVSVGAADGDDKVVAMAGNHKVTWQSFTKVALDVDTLKEKYPEVYEACLKTKTEYRLTVK